MKFSLLQFQYPSSAVSLAVHDQKKIASLNRGWEYVIEAKNTHLKTEEEYAKTFDDSIKIVEQELAELHKEELQEIHFDANGINEDGDSLVKTCIGITEIQLVNIDIKDLNKLFKKKGFKKNSNESKIIRERRRTLRNRGYARTARVK